MRRVDFKKVVTQYKAVFLDSYGVLKNSKGLIPGIQNTIAFLKEQDIPYFILTNDASRSPQQLIAQLKDQGLNGVDLSHMISSGMMTREYLKFKVNEGKIAYLGTKNSAQYINAAGLETIPMAAVEEADLQTIKAVVFLDDEGFDWQTAINKTINVLRRLNVPVIIANSDLTYPVSKREVALATGGLAEIIEKVTGKQFIHFGKPDGQMFIYAYDRLMEDGFQIAKSDILMVGDTLHTDILGGNKFGLRTMLTLSGNTSASQANEMIHTKGIIPDYIVESIGINV